MRPRVVQLLLLAAVVGACAAPRDRAGQFVAFFTIASRQCRRDAGP
jgi:heme O synthase-like polyprenyltransferase